MLSIYYKFNTALAALLQNEQNDYKTNLVKEFRDLI